jgi:hypothetical protein
MRRLGVTVGVALLCCVYAGVASAEESLVAGGGGEAVAETSELAVAETSGPPSAVRKGKKSHEPVAETSEPVSTAPETSAEPVAETSEPVSTAPETSAEPVAATSEPVSTAPETSAEPVAATSEPVSPAGVVAPAEPLADIPDVLILTNIPGLPIGSSLAPNSNNILRDVFSDLAAAAFSDLAAAASGDPRSAVRTDRRGGRDAPPANDDPSPLPGPAPHAPVPVAPAGASGASGGGSSGGVIALVAFLLLASLPLSRVVELSLTRMRAPRLVADLARPD